MAAAKIGRPPKPDDEQAVVVRLEKRHVEMLDAAIVDDLKQRDMLTLIQEGPPARTADPASHCERAAAIPRGAHRTASELRGAPSHALQHRSSHCGDDRSRPQGGRRMDAHPQ